MAYLPKRFPLKIGRDPVGGPGFKTEVATTAAGFEQRNQQWSRSRHRFDFSHAIKDEADFKEVGAHFRMARGKAHKFRARDWSDYVCERDAGLLSSVSATVFQLAKVYGDEAGFEEERRITRVYPGSLQVWKTGALQTLTTHYTLDQETGLVTFTTAPGGSLLECAFSFDVPCRYDTDELQSTLVHFDLGRDSHHSWTSVPVVEVRE